MLMLRRPTGRYPVGAQDVCWTSSSDARHYNAENHVVGRLYYPCEAPSRSSWLKMPPTWIRAYKYAQGYVAWGFHNATTFKQKATKQAAEQLIYGAGLTYRLPVTMDAPVRPPEGRPMPVIIFSHGAASMRNTYSTICTEFASRGFLVAAVEHADGTASCVQLADGTYRLLEGLGSGAVLESKCAYRVTECLSMVKVLESLNEGQPLPGTSSSAGATSFNSWRGALAMDQLAVAGHSCGGATAALAVAEHGLFKCGIALDPWWPLLPSGSAALSGWRTSSPLLAVGSQDWNTPTSSGRLFCDGERQKRVFAATTHKAPASASSAGAIHLVPKFSSHGTFTDLPFLVNTWMRDQLRKWTPGGSSSDPAAPAAEAQLQQVCWAMHAFLQRHLQLSAAQPAAHQQHLAYRSTVGSSASGNGKQAAEVVAHAGPSGSTADTSTSSSNGHDSHGLSATTSGALADLLGAADENMIVAEERVTHSAPTKKADAGPHAASGTAVAGAPEGSKAAGAVLTEERPAAASASVGVQRGELKQYEEVVGQGMYLMKEYV